MGSTDPMNLRNEMAGAWRSLRYDMDKRGVRPDGAGDAEAPDVTSTGMSTFGGPAEPITGYSHTRAGRVRTPRRGRAVAAFGALALTGAAGSYFAVVSGLGAVLAGEPETAGPYPLTADGPEGETDDTLAANAGMGRGDGPRTAGGTTTVPTTAGAVRVPPATTPAPRIPAAPRPEVTRPGQSPSGCSVFSPIMGGGGAEDGDCMSPPVPTPTAPGSDSPSPSPSDSASASPSPSDSGAPSDEPPSADPGPSDGDQPAARHHRR